MSLPDGPLAVDSTRTGRLDLYAAGLSALCLVHCLALPLLALSLPLISGVSENPLVHRALVLLAAPATLWVGWQSLPVSTQRTFFLTAFSGLALLLISAFVEPVAVYDEPITVAGSLLLAFGHLWRWRRYRSNASCGAAAEA